MGSQPVVGYAFVRLFFPAHAPIPFHFHFPPPPFSLPLFSYITGSNPSPIHLVHLLPYSLQKIHRCDFFGTMSQMT